MLSVKTNWTRIRMRYPLNEAGGCSTFACYNKKGVVIVRAYDEEGTEYFLGGKCQSCMDQWLNAFNMSVSDIEDPNAF
jgi:hypothetical protein